MAEVNSLKLLTDSSLQGYWRMQNNWNDSGPNGYNLTPTNSPTFSVGKYGLGGQFVRSSNQYANIANASCPNLEILGSQTWACWIKPSELSNYEFPMSKQTGGGTGKNLGFGDSTQGVLFTLTGLTTNSQIFYVTTIPTGVWTHILGRYDSATTKISVWVNGVKGNELTASGTATATGLPFAIGGQNGAGSTSVDGGVDDVCIFNRALSDAEIFTLYEETGGSFIFNLL